MYTNAMPYPEDNLNLIRVRWGGCTCGGKRGEGVGICWHSRFYYCHHPISWHCYLCVTGGGGRNGLSELPEVIRLSKCGPESVCRAAPSCASRQHPSLVCRLVSTASQHQNPGNLSLLETSEMGIYSPPGSPQGLPGSPQGLGSPAYCAEPTVNWTLSQGLEHRMPLASMEDSQPLAPLP